MTTLTLVAVAFVLVGGITFAVGALLFRLLPAIKADRRIGFAKALQKAD